MPFYKKHDPVMLDTGTEMLTKQDQAAQCDINNIIKSYERTGFITHVSSQPGAFMDLPDTSDYQFALNTLLEAQSAFAALPAAVRAHYDNDPAKFLAAFNDPHEETRLREWGLLKPKESQQEADKALPAASPTSDAPKPS